jgi:hypothetical protein
MSRSHRIGLLAATTAGVVAGSLLAITSASAGHLNAVLEADLSGRAEVGAGSSIAGDPNGRGEAYVFGIDGDAATLCYVLTADKIDPTCVAGQTGMAHIHRGDEATNGPVVANLAFPVGGDAADCLTEGEAGKFPRAGMAGEPASIVADILANPGAYYVNVHTGEYPSGAIRGQLAAHDHD